MRTLYIRNTRGGMIWQVYHVRNLAEVGMLENTARANGFSGFQLAEYAPEEEETWPDWRESESWKQRWIEESPTYPTPCLEDFK